jgi:hypothetical protein
MQAGTVGVVRKGSGWDLYVVLFKGLTENKAASTLAFQSELHFSALSLWSGRLGADHAFSFMICTNPGRILPLSPWQKNPPLC